MQTYSPLHRSSVRWTLTILVSLAVILAVQGAEAAGWISVTTFRGNDTLSSDHFGEVMSADGDTLLLGAYDDDDRGSGSGAAYVFVRNSSGWTQQAKLVASDGASGDVMGYVVALDGDIAVAGAFQDDDRGTSSGSAYIFMRNGETWTQSAKLLAYDGVAQDYFGRSVAVSGDTVVVGALLDDDRGSQSGSVYIYTYNGVSWSLQQKLTAPDGDAEDRFGYSVAIEGDTLVVSALLDEAYGSNAGSAYVFTRSGSTWSYRAKLGADSPATQERFGYGALIDNGTIVILSRMEVASLPARLHVFTGSDSTWTLQTELQADDGEVGDYFGYQMDLDGDRLLVGAWGDDRGSSSNAGAAYLFERTGSSWNQTAKLVHPQTGNYFGLGVAIAGPDQLLIQDRGDWAVHVFETNTPPVATDNQYSTVEDVEVSGNVIADETGDGIDSDVESDPITIDSYTNPPRGSLTLESTGDFTYTPSPNDTGNVVFTYIATDGKQLSNSATVTITVNTVNAPPAATDNTYSLIINSILSGNVLTDDTGSGADSDPDGDAFSITNAGVRDTDNGSISLAANGAFFYQPDSAFIGTDTFTYTISDGDLSDSATVTVTVSAAPPTVVNVALPSSGWNLFGYPLQQNQPVTDSLSSIDGDYDTVWGYDPADAAPWQAYNVDAPGYAVDLHELEVGRGYWISVTQPVTIAFSTANGRTLTTSSSDAPVQGGIPNPPHRIFGTFEVIDAPAGVTTWNVTVAADGTPIASFAVTADSSNPTNFVFDIPTDNPNTADREGANAGETITFSTDGAAFSATLANAFGGFTQLDLSGSAATTAGVDPDGNLTITPDPTGSGGSQLTAVYSPTLNALVLYDPINPLTAGGGGTQLDPNRVAIPLDNIMGVVTIAGGENDDSLVLDFSNGDPFPPDTVLNFDGGGNGSGGDQLLIIHKDVDEGGTPRKTTLNLSDSGTGSVQIGGTTVNFSGLEPIDIAGPSDGLDVNTGDSDDALKLNSTGGRNQVSGSTVPTTTFDAPYAGTTLAIDLGDGDDRLEIESAELLTNTQITINGGTGNDTVVWKATSRIVSGTMTITVAAENFVFGSGSTFPVTLRDGVNDKIITTEPTTVTIESGVALNVDLGPDFVYTKGTIITLIDNQHPDSTVNGTFDGLPEGAEVIIDGHKFYISYQGGDGNDVVLVTENNIVAQPANAGGDEDDGPISGGSVLNGATESYGRPLTAALVDDVDEAEGTLTFNPDGTFVFTPTVDFFGTVTFTFAATDGRDTGSPTTVTLTVSPTTDPPTPSDDSYITLINKTLTGNVITDDAGNGPDADVDGDALTVTTTGFKSTANGLVSVAADGSFFYQPNTDFVGTDTFTYTVSDGLYEETATVSVDVVLRVVNVNLFGPGWNLFSYPINETKTVTDALASINGRYQTVWGYDNAARSWRGFDVDVPDLADLIELELGQAYWITVSEPVTIAFTTATVRQAATEPALAERGALARPPAAFYGEVADVAAGQEIVAYVGDTQCAVGETYLRNGVVFYKLYVISAEQQAACGYDGATVTFEIGSLTRESGIWQQGTFQRLDLTLIPTAVSLQAQATTAPGAQIVLLLAAALTGLTVLLHRTRVRQCD